MNRHLNLRGGLLVAWGALAPWLAAAQEQASVMQPPAHPLAMRVAPGQPDQLLQLPQAPARKAMAAVGMASGCEGADGCGQGLSPAPAPSPATGLRAAAAPLSALSAQPGSALPQPVQGAIAQNLVLRDRGEAARVPPTVLAQRQAEQAALAGSSALPSAVPSQPPLQQASLQSKAPTGTGPALPALWRWALVVLACLVAAASLRSLIVRPHRLSSSHAAQPLNPLNREAS